MLRINECLGDRWGIDESMWHYQLCIVPRSCYWRPYFLSAGRMHALLSTSFNSAQLYRQQRFCDEWHRQPQRAMISLRCSMEVKVNQEQLGLLQYSIARQQITAYSLNELSTFHQLVFYPMLKQWNGGLQWMHRNPKWSELTPGSTQCLPIVDEHSIRKGIGVWWEFGIG